MFFHIPKTAVVMLITELIQLCNATAMYCKTSALTSRKNSVRENVDTFKVTVKQISSIKN